MTAAIRLFLIGDVMTGRGIDQALPHPSDPVLQVKGARTLSECLFWALRTWKTPLYVKEIVAQPILGGLHHVYRFAA